MLQRSASEKRARELKRTKSSVSHSGAGGEEKNRCRLTSAGSLCREIVNDLRGEGHPKLVFISTFHFIFLLVLDVFTLVFAVQLRAVVKIDEESEKKCCRGAFLVHSCNPLETLPGSVSNLLFCFFFYICHENKVFVSLSAMSLVTKSVLTFFSPTSNNERDWTLNLSAAKCARGES